MQWCVSRSARGEFEIDGLVKRVFNNMASPLECLTVEFKMTLLK